MTQAFKEFLRKWIGHRFRSFVTVVFINKIRYLDMLKENAIYPSVLGRKKF